MITDASIIENIEITSELVNISQVEKLIDKVCELKNISEDVYGNILIAVTEAVNNSIIHGNCFQRNLLVSVYALDSNLTLCFVIKDQGIGFDFTNLPDPTSPENLEKENGRGIFLMKNLSDDLVYEDNGSTCKIFFNYD